ncbi:PucR family transcriptional regulator [Streptomyces genisteinicus]|uniref:PucR family transcriptional regulator n=1 Tax=Streptomyces genisteinicus TaxID=2768068 RepID=A0A7H0HS89_9ACTN|nr:PucR family transcriptional regulator [Streptomyces genisteinicus]QNP63405.1 PucR family transcriptional regulator [Streptomyces genisteinicus]
MPEPSAAPPTPAVALSALLADEALGLRQVAGPSATAATAVHMVHTSEMADPYPYLLGGELLLSAGVQLGDDPDRYVARVVEAGAAALGFGVTPVYDTVPPGLAEACDRHGLPLLEVPPRTTFSAVARAVWRLMAEARHRELRRVTQAQQGLAAAAARPDPVPAVLQQLALRLEGRAVLFGADGHPLHAAGREPSGAAAAALARLAGVLAPGPSDRPSAASASDTAPDGHHLSAFALGGGQGLVLGVAAPARVSGDHTVAGVAVVLLSLLTARHRGADAASRFSALVRLLLGAAPAETAPLLGAGPWTVVHARGGDGTPFAATALGTALGSPLVDTGDDGTVRVLLTEPGGPAAQPGWTLGASAPADAAGLPAADAQAARALSRATATRKALVTHRDTAPDLLAAARRRLAPLADSPALTDTLRTWLSLHGSWDRTATALGIHRNTVRQRITRCATLLDADLDDVDVRMELWFALREG